MKNDGCRVFVVSSRSCECTEHAKCENHCYMAGETGCTVNLGLRERLNVVYVDSCRADRRRLRCCLDDESIGQSEDTDQQKSYEPHR